MLASISSTPATYDFPSPTCRNTQGILTHPINKNVFDLPPAELVDLALSRLQNAGVKLIEWRALLYRRMNVPVIVKVCFLGSLCGYRS
jgi:hypothetical protein